jgi:hypothetical protein
MDRCLKPLPAVGTEAGLGRQRRAAARAGPAQRRATLQAKAGIFGVRRLAVRAVHLHLPKITNQPVIVLIIHLNIAFIQVICYSIIDQFRDRHTWSRSFFG